MWKEKSNSAVSGNGSSEITQGNEWVLTPSYPRLKKKKLYIYIYRERERERERKRERDCHKKKNSFLSWYFFSGVVLMGGVRQHQLNTRRFSITRLNYED